MAMTILAITTWAAPSNLDNVSAAPIPPIYQPAHRNLSVFGRYIGIDYSGAQTPTASLKGLRVYLAEGDAPAEVLPPPSARKYWTRRGIAEWLVERLAEDTPTLVGIDHGFSFPLRYFEVHALKPDWPSFLDDFQRHWPTTITPMSISCAGACAATALRAWAMRGGGG
jgi:hypothetical protein